MDSTLLPVGESLEATSKRVLNYYFESIVPQLARGKTALVSAHGTSLRAMVGYIKKIPLDDIANLDVQTGVPNLYEFDDTLSLIRHHQLK